MNPKLKFGAPPSRNRPIQSADDFVSGALRPVIGIFREELETAPQHISSATEVSSIAKTSFPWSSLDDKRRRELFNIRFTDAEKAMLKFLEENGRDSMHAICIEILRPELLRRIAVLTAPQSVEKI